MTDQNKNDGGAVNNGANNGDGAATDGGQGNEVKIYRPEGMPDHYAGASDNETIDKLYKAVNGFRKDQAKGKGFPEKLDDYKLELPEEISSKLIRAGEDGKDPVFEHMRGVFHSRGISSEDAIAIMTEYASKFGDPAGDESTADFEYKSIGGAEKAQPMIDGAKTFLQGLQNSKKLSDKAVEELTLLTYHSEGLTAINELRALLGDKTIPSKIEGGGGGKKTQAELNKMMEDPKYWKEKDPSFIKEVTEGFQALYNESA